MQRYEQQATSTTPPQQKSNNNNSNNVVVYDLFKQGDPAGETVGARHSQDVKENNVLRISRAAQDKKVKNEDEAIQTICDDIKKRIRNGEKISELRFCGHGYNGIIYVGHGKDAVGISPDKLLTALEKTQQDLGVPIASKIRFEGCNIFRDLKPEEVEKYRRHSLALNAEIVGTVNFGIDGGKRAPSKETVFIDGYTSKNLENISFKNGEVVYSTPSVTPETRIERIGQEIIKGAANLFGHGRISPENAWLDCHKGKTQQEGSQCQKDKDKALIDRFRASLDPINTDGYDVSVSELNKNSPGNKTKAKALTYEVDPLDIGQMTAPRIVVAESQDNSVAVRRP